MEIRPTNPLTWLVETKFHPPLLRKDVIPRQRLLDDLRNALVSYPFTLLSAPAGYGKTTVLAALPKAEPDLSLAWLSLDEEDNDPVRFLTALIAALQHLNPTCGVTAQTLLTGHASLGVETWRVMSVLINDVLARLAYPFVLILDDLHHIREPAIFNALDYLLEHVPAQMHLVTGTRVDPPLALARLRARGQVAELRQADLRFTIEEAIAFLNDRMHLNLSSDEVGILNTRTEGWPVGLRLFASSLERLHSAEDRRLFMRHLAQTDRYIFDFLAEEVLDQQTLEIRSFLLDTAILYELTPTLCQAVTGRRDAETLLEELYHRNLFLVSMPGKRRPTADRRLFPEDRASAISGLQSYRYHDLFAEFLRHKLQQERPERLPDLHLRAAQAESDPVRAVGHYLAAARWQQAAEIIERIGTEMLARGYLDTLSRWINTLPASDRESRPRLIQYLSTCAFWKGSYEEVQPLLERALHGFEVAGDKVGQGEMLVNLAVCASFQADLERSGALFGRALAFPIPSQTRIQSLLGRALAKGAWGDWEQGVRDFKAAMTLIQKTGELDPVHLATFYFFDPSFAFLPGGLEHMERIYHQARARVGNEISPARLVIEEMTTALHLFRGQLSEAIRSGTSALALKERLGGHPFLGLDAALFLIIAHAARGDYAAADQLFELLFLGARLTGPPDANLVEVLFYVGRVRWLQGRLQEAREIYAHMCAIEDPHREIPAARIYRAWMWSLLEMAEGRYREAERALRQPAVLGQKDRSSTAVGSTRLMLARLYYRQNRQEEALAELIPTLTYHEQLGLPFAILVEGQSIVPILRLGLERGVHERYAAYLLELLGADEAPRSIYVPHTGATLTPSEVKVLRLLVAGNSNRAIAERLVVSQWTVKSHLTKIYRKLDVASRTQAVGRARELGLG